LRKGFLDDLAELVVMLSKNEDALQSLLERVLHNVVHHLVACLIKPGPVVVDHILKLRKFIKP
jgi:hypothetical protein